MNYSNMVSRIPDNAEAQVTTLAESKSASIFVNVHTCGRSAVSECVCLLNFYQMHSFFLVDSSVIQNCTTELVEAGESVRFTGTVCMYSFEKPVHLCRMCDSSDFIPRLWRRRADTFIN